MLRIKGSPLRLCDGWTRRDLLHAGGLALGGLGLADLFRLREASAARPAAAAAPHFGKAKSCILLYLYGSPSQLETFDPKPDAPVEVRGELRSIRSNVPGADVGELLPYTSPRHGPRHRPAVDDPPVPHPRRAYALTGVPAIDVPMELNPRDGRHWPFIGSVVEYVDQRSAAARSRRPRQRRPALAVLDASAPARSTAPAPTPPSSAAPTTPSGPRSTARPRGKMVKTLNAETIDFAEPYIGITPESRFRVGRDDGAADLTLDRLDARRSLLEQFDRARRAPRRGRRGQEPRPAAGAALDLIGSAAVRAGPRPAARGRGRARELRHDAVRPGVPGGAAAGRGGVALRQRLLGRVRPGRQRLGHALGPLQPHEEGTAAPASTAASPACSPTSTRAACSTRRWSCCVSEHGRTPKISNAKGGGRDHWSRAYSAVLAGGGVARGRVIGKTDRIAGDVVDRPLSPKDMLATTYHLLGIDPATTIEDRLGRPSELVPGGAVIREAL